MSEQTVQTIRLPTQQITQSAQNSSILTRHKVSFFDQSSRLSPLNSIQQIYKSTKEFITQIDNRISKSNQKSEMKSSEKYQHIIKSLQSQVLRLKKRLKLEEMITNPTKDYINDILNQIVILKRQNQSLKKQLMQSRHNVILLKSVIQTQRKRTDSPNKDFNKSKLQKLPMISLSAPDARDVIDTYLSQKSSEFSKVETRLYRYLKQLKKHPFDMNRLLHEIDKWIQSDGNRPTPQNLRLRYHLNHKSPFRKSEQRTSSLENRQSKQFQNFTMPAEEVNFQAKRLVRKRQGK